MKFITLFLLLFFTQQTWGDINWKKHSPSSVGIKKESLDKLFKYLFSSKENFTTDSALIIKHGKLIREEYANGYTFENTHRTWSISKSVTNTLVGIATKKGILSLDAKVKKFYPELNGENHEKMTLDHLLKMSSGIDWNEYYEENPFVSNVIRMLYVYEYKDMASYTAKQPVVNTPGTKFYYSSGETNLIMGILKKSMGLKDYDDFPWKELFSKMDIQSATWERDGQDVYIGSSYLYLSARDLAKIGTLYLQDGFWNKERILPEGWVKYTTTANQAWHNVQKDADKPKLAYGAQWWLNTPNKHGSFHPTAPENIFMALGHHGQILAVIPDKKIVFVRMGADKKDKIDRTKVFKYIMDSMK